MNNDSNKSLKSAKASQFHLKQITKKYNTPQSNDYHDIYTTESPTYYKKYRYGKEELNPYMNQMSNINRQRKQIEYIEPKEKFDNSQRNPKPKISYYFNNYNSVKNSDEGEKVLVKRSVNNLRNPSPMRLSGKYYKIDNNIKRSVGHSNDMKNMNNLKKEYDHQSYQEEKYAPKFYRNNPLIRTANYQRKINLEKTLNPLKPVAQKICNIIIKGEAKKNKDKKVTKILNTEKKVEKNPNFINDIKIEGNVAQGSAISYQNHKFNTNIKYQNNRKYQVQLVDKYHPEEANEENIDENENEEIEEKEEGIQVSSTKNEDTISSEQKNYIKQRYQEDGDDEENNEEEYEEEENNEEENLKENERDKVAEEQRAIEGIEGEGEEEVEKDGEEEGEMGEVDDENTKTHEKEGEGEEFTQEQVEEDENYEEKEESNVQKHEETNDADNKEDLEEYEEEEQQQIEFRKSNKEKQKRNIELKLQKESEVNLEGNKNTLKPIMEIQKVHIIQHQNDKGSMQKKNKLLDIINDDNIEIIGHKKPLILEINEESNIQLMKQVHDPIIEVQKVDNFEQIRNNKDKLKKYIFNITKKKENDVDIIPEEDESEQKLEVEKVQDFSQPRTNNRKIKRDSNKKEKKKIKFKIVKFKDGNFTLDKIEEEPEFEIQKVENFEQPRSRAKKLVSKRNKNKNNKLKVVKQKDSFEIIGIHSMMICNENNFELKRKYEIKNKSKNKKTSYKKLKQSGRNTYQYKGKQIINDAIIVPKDTRFVLKAKYKPKSRSKKSRNIVKREVTYFYKSQTAQRNEELSIGGSIKNTINPTVLASSNKNNNNINNEILKNQTKNINISHTSSRKILISSSNTNSKTNIISNSNEKSDTNTSGKKEGKNNYKTTTILSSNLVKSQSYKQETPSIRRNYLNKEKSDSITNKKSSPSLRNNSPDKSNNEISKKDGLISYNRRNHLISNISPPRENEDNNKNRNPTMTNSNSKNQLLKSEDMNSGKTQTFIMSKINSRKEIPLPKDTLKNKSHTISIITSENKSMGRTYISSNKLDQRPQSIEAKKEERNYSNNGIVFINENKKNSNKSESKNINNSRSQIYISSGSLRDKVTEIDKIEGTKGDNNDSRGIKHNTIYYSSSITKKENKPFINNNQMYISDNSSKNSNRVQTNLNRIVVTSSDNSPKLNKNSEKNLKKVIEPNNIERTIGNFDSNANTNTNIINSNQKNNNVTESIKTTTITKIVEDNENIEKKEVVKEEATTTTKTIFENDKKENQNELISNSNNLNNEDKADKEKEEVKDENILEKYSLGNELSDETKSFLNSYMSATRPELSDFSKQFLSSNVTENSGTRPELSNITRAYLFSQTPIEDDKEL